MSDTSRSVLEACHQALACGDLQQAETLASAHLSTHAEDSDIRAILGLVRLEQKAFQEAVNAFSLAVKLEAFAPNGVNPDHYYHLGLAHHGLGDLGRACQCWVETIKCQPDHTNAVINGAQAALQLRDWELALSICQTALQADVADARLWTWSGHALAKQGRDAESAVAYGHAVQMMPRDVTLRYLHALALRDSGQFDLARKGLAAVLLLAPDHADAAFEAAQLDLMSQDWASGFALWESRLRRSTQLLPEDLPGKLWDGLLAPAATLLIQAEQGFGDALQFLRYVSDAEKRVGQVILRVHSALVRLLQNWRPDLQVVAFDVPVQADLHVSLLSLPHVMDLRSPCVENAAYLAHMKVTELNPVPKIAVVWAGNPAHHNDGRRSAPFAAFQQLADVSDVEFVHFQLGAQQGADIDQISAWPDLQDGTQGVVDFYDTAQRLRHFDLVISVDTAIVHLAGALDIPTWVLVPDVPDWRWGETGKNTPWYLNVRVFRQSNPNDWNGLLSHVRAELLAQFS